MIALLLVSCSARDVQNDDTKKEEKKVELPDQMPVKVTYGRRWMYGANYETEDEEIISALVKELNNIVIGEEVNYEVTDFTDLIWLYYDDGESKFFEFEEYNYVVDNKRYRINNIKEIRNILKLIAGDEEL